MKLKINIKEKKFADKLLFKNFFCEFPERGIFALVGESGIGKTTLLRLIAGLDKKYKGEIEGGGFHNVSFSFQEYRLFPALSAIDNIIFANFDKKNETALNQARSMLSKLGFSDSDMKLLPTELSGGMKQRVSLARAFIKCAPILLLDEPSKELDFGLRKTLYELIKKESENRLVIIVSHNFEDIKELNASIINI